MCLPDGENEAVSTGSGACGPSGLPPPGDIGSAPAGPVVLVVAPSSEGCLLLRRLVTFAALARSLLFICPDNTSHSSAAACGICSGQSR